MSAAYDDNFGFWDIDGPEEHAFFEHVRRQSVTTTCERCDQSVSLLPTTTLCARCVSALECGAPASLSDYRPPPAAPNRNRSSRLVVRDDSRLAIRRGS
jgi:hypothetical protein